MPRYDAPVRDMKFILHDVLSLQNYSNLPGFEEATPDLIDAILEEIAAAHVELERSFVDNLLDTREILGPEQERRFIHFLRRLR